MSVGSGGTGQAGAGGQALAGGQAAQADWGQVAGLVGQVDEPDGGLVWDHKGTSLHDLALDLGDNESILVKNRVSKVDTVFGGS